ncbi:MAG TPA: hypothetical protein VNF74_12170 [Terriglobales bacterium]|nr:hypothetical protein [Terriglobales bacterium]
MPSEPDPNPLPLVGASTVAPGERTFISGSSEAVTGVPLPLRPARPAAAPPRDFWLRLALFATLLGAVLTILYAQVLARQDALAAVDPSGLASYHRILVPLLAITAVAGVLVLERAAALGMLLMLAGSGLALAGGGVWMLPGAFFGCVWAARHHSIARATLGFLLLLPGIAAGYYGLVSALSYASQIPVRSLPPSLSAPLTMAQALAPLQLLPLALLGAWLLVERPGSR